MGHQGLEWQSQLAIGAESETESIAIIEQHDGVRRTESDLLHSGGPSTQGHRLDAATPRPEVTIQF
jgi:hypothetical protein